MKTAILSIFIVLFALAACKPAQKIPAVPVPPTPPQAYEMQETDWKLTELMGKPVVNNETMKTAIHLILKKEDNRVQGFSGCNTIMGSYELKDGNRIAFSKMASTMMACPELATESEFNEMLGSVDNYSLNGNIMTLNKAKMAPMARFEAVIVPE